MPSVVLYKLMVKIVLTYSSLMFVVFWLLKPSYLDKFLRWWNDYLDVHCYKFVVYAALLCMTDCDQNFSHILSKTYESPDKPMISWSTTSCQIVHNVHRLLGAFPGIESRAAITHLHWYNCYKLLKIYSWYVITF